MLDLTDPRWHGPQPVPVGDREGLPRPSISMGSPVECRFRGLDVAHGGGVDLGHGVRLGDDLSLAGGVGAA